MPAKKLIFIVGALLAAISGTGQNCEPEIGSDQLISCGEPVILNAGAGFDSYLWNTGETTESITVNQTGNYSVTVNSGPDWVNSNSASFNGSTTVHVSDVGSVLDIPFVTLSAHFKPSNVTNKAYIAVKKGEGCLNWDSYALYVQNGLLHARLMIGPCLDNCWCNAIPTNDFIDLSSNVSVALNTWQHAAVTWDGSYARLYLNGVLVDFEVRPDALVYVDANEKLYIGSSDFNGNLSNGFQGLIDNVSVWNYALSLGEIQSLEDCPPGGAESGVVGVWRFDEGIGSNSDDLSSNSNTAELLGATWSADIPAEACLAGCSGSDEVFVEFINPDVLFPNNVFTCAGSPVNLSLGLNGYSALWSNGETGSSIQIFPEYDQIITAKIIGWEDVCEAGIAIDVSEIQADILVNYPNCFGGNDGHVQIIPIDGELPFTIDFHGLDPAQLSAGTYSLSIFDGFGCRYDTTFSVIQPDPLQIDLVVSAPLCNGDNSGSVSFSAGGGFSPYTFSTPGYNPAAMAPGNYTIQVNDAANCTRSKNFVVPAALYACGCTYESATNYQVAATMDDGSCIFPPAGTCPGDINGDLQIAIGDLLAFLTYFGQVCD